MFLFSFRLLYNTGCHQLCICMRYVLMVQSKLDFINKKLEQSSKTELIVSQYFKSQNTIRLESESFKYIIFIDSFKKYQNYFISSGLNNCW